MSKKDKEVGLDLAKKSGLITTENPYDPLQSIRMEGNFYRLLLKYNPRDSRYMTICKLFFATIFFVIPSLIWIIFFSFLAFKEEKDLNYLFLCPFAFLWLIPGVRMFFANMKGLLKNP